jgi:hypothetical protein
MVDRRVVYHDHLLHAEQGLGGTCFPAQGWKHRMGKKSQTEKKTEQLVASWQDCQGIVRSAGSLGPADYVLLLTEKTVLVQVVGPLDRPTREEALGLLRLTGPGRTAEIWHWKYSTPESRRDKHRRRYARQVYEIDSEAAASSFAPAPRSTRARIQERLARLAGRA